MEMGRLEFGSPRDAWGGEATAFTPLLAQRDMLAYLGEATGIGPLTLVEVEHATAGNRSLDILAETLDGRKVSIENQYRTADHDHLTRGLAYAVATESSVLVLVAEDHRDEFISVAEYLNDVALASPDQGILVWLVQVRAVRRVGDSIWSPEFVIRAEPNEWEAKIRREISPNLQSLDEYYDKCSTPKWSEFARSVFEEWNELTGARVSHNAQTTVALYHPSPRSPNKGINVAQFGIDQSLAICRGYLWESSGAFDPESEPTELDRRIDECFPNATWTDKRYYINVSADLDGLKPFLKWISEFLNEAIAAPADR